MGVDVASFPRIVRDAAMSMIKRLAMAWGGGVREKEEDIPVEKTVTPLPFASVGGERWVWPEKIVAAKSGAAERARGPDVAGGPAEAGYDQIPVEGLMDGIVRLARDGLGAAVKTGTTVGSFVTSEVGAELKGFTAEAAVEFKALRRYIGRLVCGR